MSISMDNNCNISAVTDGDSNTTLRKKFETRKALRKQLKEAENRNEEMENLLAIKDEEINELKNNVVSLNDIINSAHVEDLGKGSTIATSKISELSRRIRQLSAEVEGYKTKYEKEHAKLTKLENQTNKEEKELLRRESKESSRKGSCCEVASNLEALQEQLQTTKQKLFESLNQNTELRNSLKLAQKCIQQEIGENVNLNILAQTTSNWRGRAQQIITLQQKVAELRDRLDINHLDDTYRLQVRKVEATRKMEYEELTAKIKELQTIVDEQKNKISALKTRNKNLVDEAMNYKLKTLNLIEQSGENDNSIAALTEKMNIQKYQYDNKIKELNHRIDELEKVLQNADVNHNVTKVKLENTERIVRNKQFMIDELNETIRRLEDDMRAVCGDYLFSCRDLKKEEFVAILDALESEKEGLQQRNKVLNERLDFERAKLTTLSEQSSKQKIKIARLEGKIKDMQKEQEAQQEKKKRTQRIADYSSNLTSRLSTLIIENSNSYTDLSQRIEPPDTASEKLQIEELKNSLELSSEKIALLEEKLNHLVCEKEHDMNIFNEIMANSKNILLNMIQQTKRTDPSPTERSFIETDFQTERSVDGAHPSSGLSFESLTK